LAVAAAGVAARITTTAFLAVAGGPVLLLLVEMLALLVELQLLLA
jgi:hypothetical protein